MKHNYFYSLLAGMLLISATASAQYTEPAADLMFTPISLTNGNMETNPAPIVKFDGSAPLWKQWRYGIEGWYNVSYQNDPQTWFDVANSGVETNPSNVQEGTQSFKIKVDKTARNGQGQSWNSYDVTMTKDRIYTTTTGTYIFSMYAKSDVNSTVNGMLASLNAANKDAMYGSYINSAWSEYTSTPNWQKFSWSITAPTGVEALEWKAQIAYNSTTHYWDNASLLLINSNTITNYYESFNTNDYAPIIKPNNNSFQQIFPASQTLKVTNAAPIVGSTDGWGYYLVFENLKIKPAADKFVLRFRVKLDENAVTNGNLYCWDSGVKNYTTYVAGDENKVNFECKVFKNTQNYGDLINTQNVQITATNDGKWHLVSATFDAAALAGLGANDFISRITVNMGTPNMAYKGVMYLDDVRFGFSPTVTNSAITATTVESGNGTFSVTPSRNCDLYAVPVGTAMNKTAMDATVIAGTGFKFNTLTGAQANVLTAPYNMNSVGGTIEYQLVSYRSEEDYSMNTADKITVSKGTATSINTITGKSFVTINSGIIDVVCSQTIKQVNVFAINGQLVYTAQPNQAKHSIHVANLAKGVYVVKTTDINNQTYLNKVSN